jgi:hypothetical protein
VNPIQVTTRLTDTLIHLFLMQILSFSQLKEPLLYKSKVLDLLIQDSVRLLMITELLISLVEVEFAQSQQFSLTRTPLTLLHSHNQKLDTLQADQLDGIQCISMLLCGVISSLRIKLRSSIMTNHN